MTIALKNVLEIFAVQCLAPTYRYKLITGGMMWWRVFQRVNGTKKVENHGPELYYSIVHLNTL